MKLKALVLQLLILSSVTGFGQTFMIVATEIREGEELSRPFASQEGMIEGMFDSGYVSFDTGLYAPAMDWKAMDFREPLAIARQGLAQYLLAAEVRSSTEPREPTTVQRDSGESNVQGLLKIETSVLYYLFDVRNSKPLGRGEMFFDNESPETLELTYAQFLHSVGRDIAQRGIELMRNNAVNR